MLTCVSAAAFEVSEWGLEVEARMGRGLPGVAQMQGLVWGGLLTSSWGSTTGTHLKIRRDVSPTVTQRFSLWESGGTRSERPELRASLRS